MTKTDLIKALEYAECGSDDLDENVYHYIVNLADLKDYRILIKLKLTQSLDDALSLFEGIPWQMDCISTGYVFIVYDKESETKKLYQGTHKSAPIAVCLAYLKSLEG